MNSSAPPCPICGKIRDRAFRPFCSKRCSDVDLNRWLKGAYVIPDPDLSATEAAAARAPDQDA